MQLGFGLRGCSPEEQREVLGYKHLVVVLYDGHGEIQERLHAGHSHICVSVLADLEVEGFDLSFLVGLVEKARVSPLLQLQCPCRG